MVFALPKSYVNNIKYVYTPLAYGKECKKIKGMLLPQLAKR